MARFDPKLSESINRTMVDFLFENCERYYLFAYSMVKNKQQAERILEKTIYFSLYNSRKLKTLPSMTTWFYQLIIKDGMRKMHELDKYKRDFTCNSQLYAYMETLEPSSTNAFKLHYFESLPLSSVAEILRMKPREAESRISFVRHELKIDKYMDEESTEKLNELIKIYESANIPDDLEDVISAAVEKERESYNAMLRRYKKTRLLKPLLLIILTVTWFLATLILAEKNENFAVIVTNVPILKYLFIPFIS